jgi:rfaE bifunctional protein kinase chain/domain
MNRERAAVILDGARALGIAVVGDVCLDEYLVGSPERLSREAPVAVLALKRRFALPGGAANPARNIAALEARAYQVGIVGDDDAGRALTAALRDSGIDTGGIVVDPMRRTTTKTRVIADSGAAPYQVARIDDQDRSAPAAGTEALLLTAVSRAVAGASAVLVSDYKSGVVTSGVTDAVLEAAAGAGIWVTVDSQGDLDRFRGFHLVRAARRDVEAHVGRDLVTADDFRDVATALRVTLRAQALIISRGAAGMSVAGEDGYAVVPAANVSEVFDVTGAGDTVIAVLTAALAAGATLMDAVDIANRAAGIVVRRLGVAAPGAAEILAEYTR